jgi:hypothetical protein
MSLLDAVKVVIAVLQTLSEDAAADDLVGDVPCERRRVPARTAKDDPFAAAWAYLETLETYTSLATLRVDLLTRFGKSGTPSKSTLHRHLLAGNPEKAEVEP